MPLPVRPLAPLLACALAGCLPYAVGSTAETTPPGSAAVSQTAYAVPGGYGSRFESEVEYTPTFGMDVEVRYGLDDASDVGVRLAGPGAVVSYKRRLAGEVGGPALAGEAGLGFVNAGLHGLAMATVLASGAPAVATPYGGLRALATVPFQPDAVRDTPSVGAFVGVRLGEAEMGASLEVGVYYDRPAAPGNERPSSVLLVPSVTLHGERLMRIFWGWM